MKIIVFHRKQIIPRPRENNQEGQQQNGTRPQPVENPYAREPRQTRSGFSQFKYGIREKTGAMILDFEGLENGKIPVKGTVSIPIKSWTEYDIYFRPYSRTLSIIDREILNPVAINVGQNPENYIGRVLSTDTETLVYLRGRCPNVKGYKNILVEDNQMSTMAFNRYSSKAKHYVEEVERRLQALSQIDTFKHIGYLEAQVDILTKIILDSKLAKDKGLKSLLENALSLSPLSGKSNADISKSIQYKKVVQSLKAS